jgi:hypothetical protein
VDRWEIVTILNLRADLLMVVAKEWDEGVVEKKLSNVHKVVLSVAMIIPKEKGKAL